jgi:hypothetical protein
MIPPGEYIYQCPTCEQIGGVAVSHYDNIMTAHSVYLVLFERCNHVVGTIKLKFKYLNKYQKYISTHVANRTRQILKPFKRIEYYIGEYPSTQWNVMKEWYHFEEIQGVPVLLIDGEVTKHRLEMAKEIFEQYLKLQEKGR